MVKVSGVPYDVELPYGLDGDAIIAELERENKMMRARMERLEQEARTANELATMLNIELINLKNKLKDDLK
jgi:hypothetical protein